MLSPVVDSVSDFWSLVSTAAFRPIEVGSVVKLHARAHAHTQVHKVSLTPRGVIEARVDSKPSQAKLEYDSTSIEFFLDVQNSN